MNRRRKRSPQPRVLELRVHGVHATAPTSMLGVDTGSVQQVAGDGLTGIFRSKDGQVPLRELPDGVAVEAYSWGALTSGAAGPLGWLRRVGWLLLLPFALLNLAYWARPELTVTHDPADADGRRARFTAAVLRVSALFVTAFMVLTPMTVGVDLVAWQCYREGQKGCPALPGLLDFMEMNAPRRVAAGTVPVLLLLLLLWLLSRQSLARYEEVTEPEIDGRATPPHLVLRHPKLWSGAARTRRLQRMHLAFALCLVVVYSGIPVILEQGVDRWHQDWWFTVLILLDAVAVLLALGVVWRLCVSQPDDIEHPLPKGTEVAPSIPRAAGIPPLGLALALTAAHLAVLALAPFKDPFPDLTPLPGENVWYLAVFLGLTGIDVMLFLGRRGTPAAVPVAAGLLAVVLAVLSSTFVSHHLAWLPDETPGVAVALLAAGLVAIWTWHYGYYRKRAQARPQAFAGAGAAVLFGTAVWVALLFTTSVVAYAGDYLNGPDQSVTDLGTRLPLTVNPRVPVDHYVAEGSITLRRADVLIEGETVTVRSGSVTVESFHAPRADRAEAVSLSDRRLRGVRLEPAAGAGPIAYADSCVRRIAAGEKPPRTSCSLQRGDDAADGVLALEKGQRLVVGTRERAVQMHSKTSPQSVLTLPSVLTWAPLAQLAWAVLAALVAAACLVRLRVKCRIQVGETVERDAGIARHDKPICTLARSRAAYSHRAERLVDWLGLLVSVVSVAVIVLALTGEAPTELLGGGPVITPVLNLSLWMAIGLSAGLLALASKMRKSEETRRTVGVLWDLTTFWPRAVHPFAPPCYAERVVPELLTRIRWATTTPAPGSPWGGADLVVLSGHSQGSTLVVAAASRVPDDRLEKVRLVTYGSQLRTWYGRVFPAVFGPQAIGGAATTGRLAFDDPFTDGPVPGDERVDVPAPAGSLLQRLRASKDPTPWVNLFRRADPIGFRVFSDTDRRPDVPVREVPVAPYGDPGPRVMTHSGYQHTPEYLAELRRWTGEAAPAPSDPPMWKPPSLPEP